MSERIWVRGAHLVDVREGTIHHDAGLLLRGDRIEEIGPGSMPEGSVVEIDARGSYAIPGLFECHAHLSWLDTTPEEGEKPMDRGEALRGFLRRGVTQVRDVGGSLEVLAAWRAESDAGSLEGPEIFYAGPMLERSPLTWGDDNRWLPGFTVPVDTPEQAEEAVREIAARGGRLVKTFNKQDLPTYRRLLACAAEAGLPVVHDPGPPLLQLLPIEAALELGVRCFEHATGPLASVLVPELLAEQERCLARGTPEPERGQFYRKVLSRLEDAIDRHRLDRLIHRLLEAGACLCPTLRVFHLDREEEERPLTAAMRSVGRFLVGELARRGVPLLVGQDGCDPANYDQEWELLAQAGLTPLQLLRGATIHPAEWLGVAGDHGTLEPGRKASLALTRTDPLQEGWRPSMVHRCIKDGRLLESD